LDEFLEVVDEKTCFEALMAGKTVQECLDDAKEDEIVPSKSEKQVSVLIGEDGDNTTGISDSVTDGGSGAFGKTAIEIGLRHMLRNNEEFKKDVIMKMTKAKDRESLAKRFGIEI
jgi:hypothetical protein